MEHYTAKTEKYWEVSNIGQLTYKEDGKIIFDIEPETLTDKDKFYFLSLLPEIDEYDFLRHWIAACRAAKIKELTLTIQK